jgi:DnaA family protein
MKQLPLEIRLADHAVFGSFWSGSNGALVHALEEMARDGRQGVLWLWGGPGAGKSHLLQAAVAAAGTAGRRTAYLPLRPDAGIPPEALEGLGGLDLVALDDVDAVAGDPAWERALFRLWEELRQSGGCLVAAGAAPPGDLGIRLPDLASRLAAGATFRLHPLDDEGRLRALQGRARFRGFELPDDTGRYLLTRVERDTAALFRLLDQLDREALAARKRLTIPFVKGVLAAG